MSSLLHFHFIRPWWLLALIPLLVSWFWLWRQSRTPQSPWSQWVDPHLLPYLLQAPSQTTHQQPNKPSRLRWLPGISQKTGLYLAWLLTVLALAGPTWQQLPIPVVQPSQALVIVLDLSLSMNAKDISPSRIDRARYKIRDVLQLRRGDQIGLVTYAGDAHVVTPLTDDDATLQAMLPALDTNIMPILGSAPDLGIKQALRLLEQAGFSNGQILLMTDGIRQSDIRRITLTLKNSSYELAILGIGTQQGAPIPLPNGTFAKDAQGQTVLPKLTTDLLQQLARDSQGKFSPILPTDQDIRMLVPTRSINSALNPNELEPSIEKQFDQWRDQGPWLLLPILPWLAWQFRRGAVFMLLVGMIPLTAPSSLKAEETMAETSVADAADLAEKSLEEPFSFWQRLWQRPDQLAQQAYDAQDYARAETGFSDPGRKAAAAFHQHNYQQAVEYLNELTRSQQAETVDKQTLYNQATALAHTRQFEQAIAAYDQVLAKDPNHSAAQHNKALLESLLQQQDSQSSEPTSSESSSQQQQQESSNGQQTAEQQSSGQQASEQQDSQQAQNGDMNNERDSNNQDTATSAQSDEQGTEEDNESVAQQNDETPDQENEDSDNPSQAIQTATPEAQAKEAQQALQQWLKKVPDDPSGLLRRKFLLQSQQSNHQQPANDEAYW